MCDPIVGLVRHVRAAVDESNNVRFRVQCIYLNRKTSTLSRRNGVEISPSSCERFP